MSVCNVQTENRFEIKSHEQVEDVPYQLHRPWGIPSASYNFIPCQKVKQKGPIFSLWNLVSKLWVILRNCNEKTLTRSGDIRIFPPGRRKLTKWRNTINKMGGNIPGGYFPGANFSRGSLMGGKFPGGNFPRTIINL